MYSMHACTHFASGIPALLAEELLCTKTREDVKKTRHQHVVQYDRIHIHLLPMHVSACAVFTTIAL